MEPLDLYTRTARKRWWVPPVFVIVSVVVAVVVTSQQTPVYRSAATTAVVPSEELAEASEVMRGLETLERRTVVATFARMAEARQVRAAAAGELGLEMRDVRGYWVDASVVPSTNIIRIAVEGPDPERASLLANALTRVTETEARAMYRIFGMRTLEEATPRSAPIRPTPGRNYTVAAILGLFLGVLAALALEYLRSGGTDAVPARERWRAKSVAGS